MMLLPELVAGWRYADRSRRAYVERPLLVELLAGSPVEATSRPVIGTTRYLIYATKSAIVRSTSVVTAELISLRVR